MSAINIKIQKKDLWLISAIMVFLVGVGYVIAYGGNQPTVHGHSAEEIEGGSGVNSYDSGWFAVSSGQTYTKDHNLGTRNIITDILFAPDSGGAPDLNNIWRIDRVYRDSSHAYGAVIKTITDTSLTVQTSHAGVSVDVASGWYKVLAISID